MNKLQTNKNNKQNKENTRLIEQANGEKEKLNGSIASKQQQQQNVS